MTNEVTTSNDALAIVLAHDYSKFHQVDNSQETQNLKDAIDSNLAVLEEFCQLFEALRNESSNLYDDVIPLVQSKIPLLDQLSCKVDELEKKVEIMKESVDRMESAVSKAEEALNPGAVVKKFIGSWFSGYGSRASSSSSQADQFSPPEIFRTDELFPDGKNNE